MTGAIYSNDNLGVIEDAMVERVPSHVFIARAVPTSSGRFHALLSAPGLVPNTHKDKSGNPQEFDTAEEAELVAMRALFAVLNKPRQMARKKQKSPERYRKMTNVEFAVTLQNVGLTPTFFAFLYGTSQARVIQWIDGTDAVPHPARIFLAIFAADEKAIDIAEEVTEQVTTSRRELDQ